MTTEIDITEFCDPQELINTYMTAPLELDDKIIATNGKMIIVTTKTAAYHNIENNHHLPSTIESIIRDIIENLKTTTFNLSVDIFEQLPPKPTCRNCNGTKKIPTTDGCPECFGTGNVNFENEYSNYEITCESCNGSCRANAQTIKKVPQTNCRYCQSTGKAYHYATTMKIHGQLYSPALISIVAKYPNLKLAINKKKHQLLFKSGKYSGVIMGLIPPTTHTPCNKKQEQ